MLSTLIKTTLLITLLISTLLFLSCSTKNRPINNAITYKQMQHAIQLNNIEEVGRLIDAGADLSLRDKYGRSYFHHSDNPKITQMLVRAGADINMGDRNDVTTLHNAIKENNLEKVKLLLRLDAMVNKQNNSGLTPLHYIGFAGKSTSKKSDYDRQIEILKLLLRHGADVKIASNRGQTVLHLLTFDYKVYIRYDDLMQRIELTKILLKHGADINAKDNDNWSVLLYAAYDYKNADTVDEKGYVEWFQFLIDNGIEVDTQNNKGDTPIDVMRRARGTTPSVKTLIAHSASYKSRILQIDTHKNHIEPYVPVNDEETVQSAKEKRAKQIAEEFASVLGKTSRKEDKQSSMKYIESNCRGWIEGFTEKDQKLRDIVFLNCTKKSFSICCYDMR